MNIIAGIFGILTLITGLAVLIGLVKPGLVVRWGENKTRLRSLLIYVPICIITGVGASSFSPAKLDVINLSINNDTVVSSSEIVVKGELTKEAKVTINGNESFVKNMLFEENIPLNPGKNEIKLSLVGEGDEQKLITIIVTRVSDEELKEKNRLQKIEDERLAKEKAEKERLQKIEEKRLAKEKAEKERLQKIEEKRLAKEKAEKERLAKIIGKPDQYQFHTKLKDIESRYDDEDNQMKKSKIARELRDYSKKYLKKLTFRGWKGELSTIATPEGGDWVHISILSTHDFHFINYRNNNNLLLDYNVDSVIKLNSKVYKQLENLEEGAQVIFSGKFVRDNDRGVLEGSYTEEGWVTSSEFIIIFSDIKKQ